MTQNIVLASKSPRRIQMFKDMQLNVRSIAADIDETQLPQETAIEMSKRLSGEKALAIATLLAKTGETPFVVGADTIVVLNNQVLNKPNNPADAKKMLQSLSGNTHCVVTGWTVGKYGQNWTVRHTETKVTFFQLSDEEIDTYVATGECTDKAGAYAIQGIGSFLVKEISGDFYNVVGLPIAEVMRTLIKNGAIKGFLST